MLNTSKIKGRMITMGVSINDVAFSLGLSLPVTKKKINNLCPLSLAQAEAIANLLKIESDHFCEYFFA